MQKILAKYGLAAHLAFVAVAPLFLFPFLRDASIATVLLWMTLLAAIWAMMSPSVRSGEMPHEARARAWRHVLDDPMLIMLGVVVAFAGLRALNTGIARTYDPETGRWMIAAAALPWLPSSVGDCGYLPFVTAVAFVVVYLASRHALGGSGRMALLAVASSLSGIAAVIAIISTHYGCAMAKNAMTCGIAIDHLVGTAFAVNLLGGIVATTAAFEHKWNIMLPLLVLSGGANVAGCFVFLGPLPSAAFVLPMVMMAICAFFHLRATCGMKSAALLLLLTAAASLIVGWLLVRTTVPAEVLSARYSAILDMSLVPECFVKARSVLASVAERAWHSHAMIGLGCGSTPLVIEFFAEDGDWTSLPVGVATIPNGWMRRLSEGGIVGLVALVLPFGALLFVYAKALLAGNMPSLTINPSVWLFPAVAISLVAVAFVDVSPFRAEVLVLFGAISALSINSIAAERK